MQFFERQEVQRKYTRWLLLGFIAAILLVVVVINLVVMVGVGGNPIWVVRRHPEYIVWVSLVVLATKYMGDSKSPRIWALVTFVPLIGWALWIGVRPDWHFHLIEGPVEQIMGRLRP